ncbi:hypothetical protein BASA50_008109 [Batrachochytrium salamandrivorans]|uniref:F-box domain-containing protein n=1 Tax=Batrachochytrium salamandrivorans TaxID=1357716 RepID=A0ABQ8F5B4_9FUNG|nr:hypothetical protein BASA50_008109 [Batrachochytrium salamandrivorans]
MAMPENAYGLDNITGITRQVSLLEAQYDLDGDRSIPPLPTTGDTATPTPATNTEFPTKPTPPHPTAVRYSRSSRKLYAILICIEWHSKAFADETVPHELWNALFHITLVMAAAKDGRWLLLPPMLASASVSSIPSKDHQRSNDLNLTTSPLIQPSQVNFPVTGAEVEPTPTATHACMATTHTTGRDMAFGGGVYSGESIIHSGELEVYSGASASQPHIAEIAAISTTSRDELDLHITTQAQCCNDTLCSSGRPCSRTVAGALESIGTGTGPISGTMLGMELQRLPTELLHTILMHLSCHQSSLLKASCSCRRLYAVGVCIIYSNPHISTPLSLARFVHILGAATPVLPGRWSDLHSGTEATTNTIHRQRVQDNLWTHSHVPMHASMVKKITFEPGLRGSLGTHSTTPHMAEMDTIRIAHSSVFRYLVHAQGLEASSSMADMPHSPHTDPQSSLHGHAEIHGQPSIPIQQSTSPVADPIFYSLSALCAHLTEMEEHGAPHSSITQEYISMIRNNPTTEGLSWHRIPSTSLVLTLLLQACRQWVYHTPEWRGFGMSVDKAYTVVMYLLKMMETSQAVLRANGVGSRVIRSVRHLLRSRCRVALGLMSKVLLLQVQFITMSAQRLLDCYCLIYYRALGISQSLSVTHLVAIMRGQGEHHLMGHVGGVEEDMSDEDSHLRTDAVVERVVFPFSDTSGSSIELSDQGDNTADEDYASIQMIPLLAQVDPILSDVGHGLVETALMDTVDTGIDSNAISGPIAPLDDEVDLGETNTDVDVAVEDYASSLRNDGEHSQDNHDEHGSQNNWNYDRYKRDTTPSVMNIQAANKIHRTIAALFQRQVSVNTSAPAAEWLSTLRDAVRVFPPTSTHGDMDEMLRQLSNIEFELLKPGGLEIARWVVWLKEIEIWNVTSRQMDPVKDLLRHSMAKIDTLRSVQFTAAAMLVLL